MLNSISLGNTGSVAQPVEQRPFKAKTRPLSHFNRLTCEAKTAMIKQKRGLAKEQPKAERADLARILGTRSAEVMMKRDR